MIIRLTPTNPVLQEERAAFEEWHTNYHPQPFTIYGDNYSNAHVRARWQGWIAHTMRNRPQ